MPHPAQRPGGAEGPPGTLNLKKGDKAIYRQAGTGELREVDIVSVDYALSPPSYVILIDGRERETEGARLTPLPKPAGEAPEGDKKGGGGEWQVFKTGDGAG